jgi:hypothetical protein
MGSGAQAVFSDIAEVIALLQALDAVFHRRRGPELLLDDLGGLLELTLVPQLREHDVPGEQGHQHEHDQGAASDEVALRPERLETVGIIYYFGGCFVFHDFLVCTKGAWRAPACLKFKK